ncbi:TonB-dependent receptor plug domain-containing protein [Sphingobacterium sp. LRF_L2]|uniref:M56 family metallopeptidase n=1 Tax=Sphingobacterium sp. LRF_L2 TaxID=3369421 RepID=UPI003F636CA3
MDSLFAYILQVNILLAVVYGGYVLLLKTLTFYNLNRYYFLFAVVFALTYPFLDIKSLFQRHIEPVGEWIDLLPLLQPVNEKSTAYTLEHLIYLFVALGILWFTIRLGIQLGSLLRIHLRSVDASWRNYMYRHVLFPIVPFSFLNKIYLHKEQHREVELYDIFKHEDIHVKGLHSLDILLFEMLLIGCWYNPFVWLMRRAVRQNLEFLTDQQVLDKGADRQAYQYSLLQVSKHGASVSISNQFNFKLLKKRIMMMNKKRSSKIQLSKYAFLLPIIIFSAGAFTVSKADDTIEEAVSLVKETNLQTILKPDSLLKVKMGGEAGAALMEVLGTDTLEIDTMTRKTEGEPLVFIRTSPDSVKRPLLVVDGVRKGRDFEIKDLNPEDIKEMAVWKTEAKTVSIYGQEAKDGVIEITTKHADQTNTIKKGVLYVIDGVPQENGFTGINKIDPNTIESVEVLKDTKGKSIYGNRAVDGVILITTKSKQSNSTSDLKNEGHTGAKEIVVVGKKMDNVTFDNIQKVNESDAEKLKKFLDDNRSNIDLKADFVLIINGKIANEADLKKIKAEEVSQLSATDLTERNSNLPKNVMGVLSLTDGNKNRNRGSFVSIYNGQRRIELIVDPSKNSSPYIERK